MTTPLRHPITIDITLETQEDLLGLLLRVNLDPENLRHWYHEVRGKTDRNIPETRFTDLYRALKAQMDNEGFTWDMPVQADPVTIAAKSDDMPF